MKNRLFRIIFFTLIGAGIVFGYFSLEKMTSSSSNKNDNLQDNLNIVKTPLDIGGEYSLTTHRGDKVTNKNFEGKIVLMFFGYTYCPDYCPMELQNLSLVLKELDQEGIADKIQPIFVSVDPERDTQEVLTSFLEPFDHRILAMTGTEDEIQQIKENFRVYAAKVNSQSEHYLMDHTTFLYVIDEEGKFKSMIRYEASAEEIIDYIKSILNA